MDENPFETRRRGIRRVRAVTAWVAGAAVAGTGVAAVAVATEHPAQAATSTQSAQQATGDDGTGQATSGDNDGGFQQPAQVPASGFGDSGGSSFGSHASSGGS